jgi:hypothetical protein
VLLKDRNSTKGQVQGYMTYCSVAAQSIGSLQTCSSDQLIAWAALAKVCFGSDVSQWTPSTVTVVGAVVGGLGKTDLADLDINTVTNIQPWTIWMIPTANVNVSIDLLFD